MKRLLACAVLCLAASLARAAPVDITGVNLLTHNLTGIPTGAWLLTAVVIVLVIISDRIIGGSRR
jgi:hypothetical protein